MPDINKAQADFVPDVDKNAIYYSLSTVVGVNDELFESIVNNRPYTDSLQFYSKINPTTSQMINLIKAGCFDALENKSRQVILETFLNFLAQKDIPLKTKIGAVQLKKAIALGMPELKFFKDCIRVYKYRLYLENNCLSSAEKRFIINDSTCIDFFNIYIKEKLDLKKEEYSYLPDNAIAIKQTPFKKVVDAIMEPLMSWLNSEQGLQCYNNLLQKEYIQELKDKYCQGNLSTWEMATMNFYYSGYELANVNNTLYGIKNFNTLKDDSKETCALAGTIINVINAKKTISILTNYGVVDVKFYSDTYNKFNQKISEIDSKTKKKVVIDDSWFKRGNKVIVYGSRREETFVAKNCKINDYYRCLGLIEEVYSDGSLKVRYSRNKKGK